MKLCTRSAWVIRCLPDYATACDVSPHSKKSCQTDGSRPTGGGDGIRTHCLYIANVALYQLSYTPEEGSTLTQRSTWLELTLPTVVLIILFVVGFELIVVAR